MAIRKHHHSPEQQSQLLDLIRETSIELLGAEFSEPKNDDVMIRWYIHRAGKLAAFKQLYEDSYPDPVQINDPTE